MFIRKKKLILFIPHPMPSHIIPLVALAKMLDRNSFDCAFLLQKGYHEILRSLNFKVLDIDRSEPNKLSPEIEALTGYNADVIVDDLSFTAAFSSRLTRKPRISIVRKGIIPFESVTACFKHSSGLEEYLDQLSQKPLHHYGLWKPCRRSDLFVGDINIVPSIPSVEILPKELQIDQSYIYSGPLLLEDEEMMRSSQQLTHIKTASAEGLEAFFTSNATRQIVYFTCGLAEPSEIKKRSARCVRILLEKGLAIITNISDLTFQQEEEARIFASDFVPMHRVCEKADVMIHQCGSGTYSYQLCYGLPGIVLGTNCYDRDDIGRRLSELNVCYYVSDELDEDSYYRLFDEYVTQLLDHTSQSYFLQKESLKNLQYEIVRTKNNFDFEQLIGRLPRTTRAL